jgi:hypothetical protein
MSFTDWSLAPQPQSPLQQQQALSAQQDNLQRLRGLSALRGVDLGDQNSVGSALNGLAQLGMADQAKGLLDLSNQRTISSKAVPLATSAIGLAQSKIDAASQPSASQPPDLDAAHRQILQQGADAVNDLLNTADPAQRATKAAAYKQQFAQQGIPQANIDEVLGDLSDQGLQAHEKYLTAAAGGDASAPHPTGYAASQALLNSDPMYRNAEGVLTGPMADPTVQAALKQYGNLDLGPGINQALEETGPGRTQAAAAAFAPTVAAATTTATNLANLNTLPAVQQAVAEASAKGTAAGSPMEVTLQDGSKQRGIVNYDESGKPYFVPIGQAPPSGGGKAGAPISSPSIAGGEKQGASGQQYSQDLAAAAASQPAQVAMRKVVDLLPGTNVGPGVEATNGWRSFILSQLPILAPLIPGGLTQAQVQTASTNELKKYMVQTAGAAAAPYGAGTNEKLAFASSGNPNLTMDKLSALDVSRMNVALQRAQNAKPYLFSTTKEDPGQYSDFASNYARTVDPRAFMLDMLSVPERDKLLSTITTPEDRAKFQRGVQAAEAAGYFTRADLPR